MPESLVRLWLGQVGTAICLFVFQRGYPECNTLPFWTPDMPSRVSWKGPQPWN